LEILPQSGGDMSDKKKMCQRCDKRIALSGQTYGLWLCEHCYYACETHGYADIHGESLTREGYAFETEDADEE